MNEYTPTEKDLTGAWVEAFEAAGSELSPHELESEARRGITKIKAAAWDEGYRQGVDDERTAEAVQVGIGLGGVATPNRTSPYRKDEK